MLYRIEERRWRRNHPPPLGPQSNNEQSGAQLLALENQGIDTTAPDAPEVTDWSTVERGKFYRPLKEQVTIHLDSDVLAWCKQQPEPYQTLINTACQQYMEQHTKRS
jgi:uncharacterized protein (DUF4415 family)